MTLLTRFEIVLVKLVPAAVLRTTVRFFPHERTYGAGNGNTFPHMSCQWSAMPAPRTAIGLHRDILSSTSRGHSLPTLTCFLFLQKLVLPTVLLASVSVISARTSWCTGFCILYPCSQSFGVQWSSLPGFLSTSECFLFLLVLENGIGVLIHLLSYICGVIYVSNARTSSVVVVGGGGGGGGGGRGGGG